MMPVEYRRENAKPCVAMCSESIHPQAQGKLTKTRTGMQVTPAFSISGHKRFVNFICGRFFGLRAMQAADNTRVSETAVGRSPFFPSAILSPLWHRPGMYRLQRPLSCNGECSFYPAFRLIESLIGFTDQLFKKRIIIRIMLAAREIRRNS